jgi:hypothetical protein
MTGTRLILFIAAATSALLSVNMHAHEPDDENAVRTRESRFHLIEAEFDVSMHELEVVMSQRELEEARIEVEKTKLQLEAAVEEGKSREVEFAKLQRKQAEIRVQKHEIKVEIARVSLERAKGLIKHLGSSVAEQGPRLADTEVRDLLTQKRDVLQERLDGVLKLHELGTLEKDRVLKARNDVLSAELDLAVSKADRITVLESQLQNLRERELMIARRYEEGTAQQEEKLVSKADRLSAEIALLREKSKN